MAANASTGLSGPQGSTNRVRYRDVEVKGTWAQQIN